MVHENWLSYSVKEITLSLRMYPVDTGRNLNALCTFTVRYVDTVYVLYLLGNTIFVNMILSLQV